MDLKVWPIFIGLGKNKTPLNMFHAVYVEDIACVQRYMGHSFQRFLILKELKTDRQQRVIHIDNTQTDTHLPTKTMTVKKNRGA